MNEQITLNGVEVWALVCENEDGFRVRIPLDDGDRCRLHPGERIPMRRRQRPVEMPPVAWFDLQVRLAMAC